MFSGHLKLPQTIPDSPLDGPYSGSQVPPVWDRRHLATFAPLRVVGGSLAGSAIVREQSIPSIDLAVCGCQMPRFCTWGGRTAIAAVLVLVYRVLEYISLSLPTKLQCFGVGICDCFYFLAAKVCLVGT